ncbi:unnamed protein product [Polarella glacialis]|uniref:Palmitoyltransferase n=1 Tax=Polarella glacialis TaxID=89957 RepID=A0A813DVJ4_POLGL|nr:unnamed protein product [Polarella glacialis]
MESGDGRELLPLLPLLPKPDLTAMRTEGLTGCTLVCGLIAGCLTGTHTGASMMRGFVAPWLPAAFLVLIYLEAMVALLCLLGLMLGDPGVVERSEQTCLPIPAAVAECLQAGKPMPTMENIMDGDRSYCVRCHVWRTTGEVKVRRSSRFLAKCDGSLKPAEDFHHCSTCQRCVVHFDHHCGVFGRCIAGCGFGGNMGYFKVIIAMGGAGVATAGAAFTTGLLQTGQGRWLGFIGLFYMGFGLLAILATCCVAMCESLPSIWRCCLDCCGQSDSARGSYAMKRLPTTELPLDDIAVIGATQDRESSDGEGY